jgi:putative ABC transport system permease protein
MFFGGTVFTQVDLTALLSAAPPLGVSILLPTHLRGTDSVIVAVLGIVNTLALSVFERTREIGLLRAVGLRRRQLSEMITIEAIATAVFGAVLGTVLGLGLGIAVQHALISQGIDTLAVSWPIMTAMILAAGAVGVLAAVLPSLRAVRLDILTAVAADG